MEDEDPFAAFRAQCPMEFYVPEPVIARLAEQVILAASKLTDSKGLRVIAPQDFDRAWAAAHTAISAATGALINPVLPEGWVRINSFGAEGGLTNG